MVWISVALSLGLSLVNLVLILGIYRRLAADRDD